MKPIEIRKQVLAEHVELRQTLERIEGLADRVLATGDDELASLRGEATGFLDALLTHMEWEDDHLAAALRAGGELGKEFAASLARDHAEQRDLLEHILRGLADTSRPGRVIARNLHDLCRLLRDDIVDEEEMLLKAEFLQEGATIGGEADTRET
jgi:hemerythrin-like domain-containing protein